MLFRFLTCPEQLIFWADTNSELTVEEFSFRFKCFHAGLFSPLAHGAVPGTAPQYQRVRAVPTKFEPS
jgi:hypothetical protein